MTGAELWSFKLPFGGYAPPSVYEVHGREYVVIAATGGGKLNNSARGDTTSRSRYRRRPFERPSEQQMTPLRDYRELLTPKINAIPFVFFIALCMGIVVACTSTERAIVDDPPNRSRSNEGLWDHDNLVAWCVVPFDAKKRGPEERAQMLEKLGFKHFAYDWDGKDRFDAEIEAMQSHGIDLLAWLFPAGIPNDQRAETCSNHLSVITFIRSSGWCSNRRKRYIRRPPKNGTRYCQTV